jgi:hypothetical protein
MEYYVVTGTRNLKHVSKEGCSNNTWEYLLLWNGMQDENVDIRVRCRLKCEHLCIVSKWPPAPWRHITVQCAAVTNYVAPEPELSSPRWTFRNKLNFNGTGLLAPAQPQSWRATPCLLSATAYSIYSHLPSISEGRLLHRNPRKRHAMVTRGPLQCYVETIGNPS